jgi:GT2 family glycosyltransferase
MNKQYKVAVILLNWNGEEDSLNCINALKKQTLPHTIIAVDNYSNDNFVETLEKKFSEIILLKNDRNKGFAGGVNTGIRYAIEKDFDYVALINNDATPDPTWLSELLHPIAQQPTVQGPSLYSNVGIVTGKLLKTDGTIDSTGDLYTSWGLAYPRGRNTADEGQYDVTEEVFGATGGASLYKTEMLKEIGLFDEDFFAYYEDVDISFRAQLAGWKVVYTPKAVAYHKVGASSSKVPGLTTYMAMKNMPWLMWKNVPRSLMPTIMPRFFIAHLAIVLSALSKGKFIPVFKGIFVAFFLFPKIYIKRLKIQKTRKVSNDYIKSIITYDLPPNAHKLQKVRSVLKSLRFWK